MKIAIISEYNVFTTVGGTEYYVDMLIKGLCAQGHELILITKGKQTDQIEKILQVAEKHYTVCFLPSVINSKAEVKQKVVSSSWEQMLPVLEQFQPDIIHVHTLTTFFNIRHFELCVQKFQPVFFTSHIPGHFCPKGDLIQNNHRPCNGKIGSKCSVCLFSKSIKSAIANLMFRHTRKTLQILHGLNELDIKVICTANWQKEQMIRNSYNKNNIHVIRQALITANYKDTSKRTGNRKLSIGYLGRLSPEKGSAMLLQLIRTLNGNDDFRFVLGIPENSNPADLEELKQLMIRPSTEIELLRTVHAGNKQEFFEQIDCLLIPSFCIETGPIVLLEAILYNKQVIAPDIGGSLEFAEEFPGEVITYSWNNVTAAVEMIKKIKQLNNSNSIDQRQVFSVKEKLFVTDHLALYEQALNTNHN